MGIFSKIFSSKPNPIYKSIEVGNIYEIRSYLNGDNDLNSDFQLESILHYAINNCEYNYFQTIEFLINNGVDLNSHHSKLLESPLHRICARATPQLDVITLLLEK